MEPPARLAADVGPAVIEGLHLHQHALAAPVGVVVHLHLLVFRVVPDLVGFDADDVVPLGPAQDALAHDGADGIREQGQDIDMHGDHGSHPLQKLDGEMPQGRVQ